MNRHLAIDDVNFSISTLKPGTMIYLRRNTPNLKLSLGEIVDDYELYLAYDLHIGYRVIPRGTRVKGQWITSGLPNPMSQLIISKIYPIEQVKQNNRTAEIKYSNAQEFLADSDFFINIQSRPLYKYNRLEYVRRITSRKPITETFTTQQYNLIDTREIVVYLREMFVPFPTRAELKHFSEMPSQTQDNYQDNVVND
jgi:hypothetical protein